jgi:hypothetical protein
LKTGQLNNEKHSKQHQESNQINHEPDSYAGKPYLKIGILLFLVASNSMFCAAHGHHNLFQYSSGTYVNPALFIELEKDLSRPINFSLAAEDYSYVQHLKNHNTFNDLISAVRKFDAQGKQDSLIAGAKQLLQLFQNTGRKE